MTRPPCVYTPRVFFNYIENRCVVGEVKFDKLKRKNAPL